MKRIILVLLFVLLVACDNTGPKGVVIPQGATVLILGDSLSYGTGAKAGEDYSSLLERSTG